MDLVERESAPGGGAVAGRAPVDLSAAGRELAGVATAPARRATWSGGIRTVGTVLADERGTYRIEARFGGWVEKLQADFAGRRVAAGETLAEIFSPELVAAQQEYLLARQAGVRFTGSSLPEVRRGGEDLIAAARRRLEIFDLPPGFIAALEGSGVPRRTVPVTAPASGFLVDKQVFAGQQVMPGQELFRLVDLSRVWVEARLYEIDAARVSLGDAGRLSLAYDPARVRTGRVTYIYPEVDAATRTLRVRFDVPNGDLAWTPGMFVDAELGGRPREVLAVPDEAVLDTGERRLVFVETQPGHFEPREVGVGERRSGEAEILSGLAEGEEVAVKANFLLDSESRLRAAIAASSAEPTAIAGPDSRPPAPIGREAPR
jgi:multidrug efflux pump subunit AcrA (membrane-fusion protein)